MQTWEYCEIEVGGRVTAIKYFTSGKMQELQHAYEYSDAMRQLVQEGWELVSAYVSGSYITYTFKRPLP